MTHPVLATNIFLLPNATFIAEVITFLIILGILWRYVVPWVQRNMTARQEMIRKQIEESRAAKERLTAAEAEYREALGEARRQAAAAVEDARARGERLLEQIRQDAEQERAARRDRLATELAAEREQAVRALRDEIGRLAVELAGRVVGEALTDPALARRVVDRFLDELDASGDGELAAATADQPGEPQPAAPAEDRR